MSTTGLLRLCLFASACSIGALVAGLLTVAGWSGEFSVVTGTVCVFVAWRRQRAHFQALAATIDRGRGNLSERQVMMARRAAIVTWSSVGGTVAGYVVGCVLFFNSSPMALILRSNRSLEPMVAPDVRSHGRSAFGPWYERYPPEKPGLLGMLRYISAVGGGLLVGSLVRSKCVPRRGRRVVARGRVLLGYSDAIYISQRCLPPRDPGLSWGGIRLPTIAAASHFCAVGTTGSGKTLTLRMLMQDALTSIGQGADCRALVYDAKQDMLPYIRGMGVGCEVYILNAFDLRGTAWDMGADCDSPAVAMQIASILIPEEDNANRFFPDASRHLLSGALTSLIKSCPGRWDFRDVVLAMQSANAIRALVERVPETQHLVQYFAEQRTFSNILSTLSTKMAPFEPVAAAWSRARRKVSLTEWVRGESILLLGNYERARYAMDAVNRVIFRRASELLLEENESNRARRTWLFLDETKECGALDGLSSLLTKGRSRGVSVVIGFQDIEGLREVYGERIANEMVAQCGNKAILRLESPETARWASAVAGECERYEYQTSHATSPQGRTRTVSEQLVKREAVLPSEFMDLLPTNRAHGLTGYFMSPYIGVYRATIPGEELDRRLKPRDVAVGDFVSRPREHEYLHPWTPEDCGRLGLDPGVAVIGGGTGPRPASPPKPVPKIVRADRRRRLP